MVSFTKEFSDFNWIDLTNPPREKLDHFSQELNISKKILYNCLDPDYLPHVETHGETHFLLLRLMEPGLGAKADSVQELTTKVAVFVSDKIILTIHRLPLREVSDIQKLSQSVIVGTTDKSWLIGQLMEQVSIGFNDPLTDLEKKLSLFEEKVFQANKTPSLLLEGYYIKRKASAFKKIMKLSLDAHTKILTKLNCSSTLLRESKDRLERNLFYAEDVHENIQSLLSIQLSLQAQKTNEASYRTNEIVRVLTVLSLFFLPLNFIAGVFGMNFEGMPLIKSEFGFWISVVSMVLVCLTLGGYVFRKGWLKDRPQLEKDLP